VLIFVRIALLGLTSFRLLAIVGRRFWRRGAQVTVHANAVDVHIRRGKHDSLEGAHVSVDLPGALHFSLEREGAIDRLAKTVAIAREWQTGDTVFDGRIYITCDDTILLESLSSDTQLRAALMRVLSIDGRAVYCASGRIWIKCDPEGESRDLSDELLQRRFAERLDGDLRVIRDRLAPLAGSAFDSPRDAALAPRKWIAAVSAVCAVLGLVGGAYDFLMDDQQVVRENIVRFGEWITGGAALAMLTWFAVKWRGTSVAHRALFDILFAAVPGVWLAAGGALTAGNEYLDASPPARYSVRVDNLYKKKTKSSWNYHLVVASWPDARGEREVKIDKIVFDTVQAGGCVDVIWRRGNFGDGWVSGYQQNTTNICEGTFVE